MDSYRLGGIKMEIGRRIFYNLSNGNIVRDTGERKGDVIETTPLKDFSDYETETMDYIQLGYGERKEEFQNKGSYRVDVITKELIIYPMLKAEQTHIATTINQEVNLKVFGIEQGNVTFTLDDTSIVKEPDENGDFIIPFSSDVVGEFIFQVSSEVNGSTSITVEVSEI